MSDPNDTTTTGRDPRDGDAITEGTSAGATDTDATRDSSHAGPLADSGAPTPPSSARPLPPSEAPAPPTIAPRTVAPPAATLPPSPTTAASPPRPDSASASLPPKEAADENDLGRDDDGYGFGRDDDSRDSRSRRPPEERSQRRSGFESLLRDSFRKAVERGLEVGMGTLKSADHVVHKVADEVKMPKEISNYLFSQIDETKNVLIRAVAGEVREFLDTTDLATELQRALTALSFEVRMEIRFIPNEAGELKPKVKTKAVPRARRADRPERGRGARNTSDSDGDPDSDDGT